MSDLIPLFAPWSGRIATVVIMLLGLTIVAVALCRRRHGGPRCPRCRYDLSATPLDRPCPECGTRSTADRRARSPRRWRLAIIGLLIAASLPTYVAQRRVRRFGWDYYLKLNPIYSTWPETTVGRARHGDVIFVRRRERRWGREAIEVRWRRRLLGRFEDWSEVYLPGASEPALDRYPGSWRDPDRVLLPDDINSDGAADAIVTQLSGKYSTTTIVSITEDRAWLIPVAGPVDENVEFLDLDDDGIFEAVTADDTFWGWRNAYSSRTQPRVVLAWGGRAWMFSPEHMAAPAPAPEELEGIAREYVEASEPYHEVWFSGLMDRMLDLIYSGNAASAIELAHLAWQPRWEGSADGFLADIAKQLATSPHFAGIQNLNPAVDFARLAAEGEGASHWP